MKILLNCLPPTDVNSPSISLSVLKTFMQNHGFETEIKYWNFLLSMMSEYTESEDTEIRLLPFLSIINDRNGNKKGNNRILSLLQKIDPSYKTHDPHYYAEFLQEKKEEIFEIIHEELELIDFGEISLIGISAKYSQWIPGMILAEEIKKIAPQVKIIVGGFGSMESAREAMKLCQQFDFVTWGEGEYPLMQLCEELQKETPDFTTVPRLIFKESDHFTQSLTTKSEYLDFDNYTYPDYEDFINNFPETEDEEEINLPINSIRSCHWRKCKFCDFNHGYKLRARRPECIVNEIEHLTTTYGHTTFSFVDSDTFGDLKHFEKLLDLLIDLRYRTEEDFSLWAEIIPNDKFDAPLMQKMAIAGFKNLFIGYDGLCDSLLKKMNKSNSFADNVFFVKYSLKNGIAPFVNVIRYIPGETEEDIQECIDNLHFLRFFYNDSVIPFSHNYVNLVLSSMTKYYKLMPDTEHEKYDKDDLSYLLPDDFSNTPDRFHLFRYEKNAPANTREWENLKEIEEYYKTNKFSYKFQEHNSILYYTEYCNDEEIENIVFGEPEYAFILKAVEQKVCSFSRLFPIVKKAFPHITEPRLIEILTNLKSSYLIYCNVDFSEVVSVVEV